MQGRRELGPSGIRVRPIGYGAMALSTGDHPTEEDALAVLQTAIENGVELIDTADVYGEAQSPQHGERLIGKALRASRAGDVIVATKGGLTRTAGKHRSDASPDALRRACEASLRRLQLDAIPLYQLHAPDRSIPLEDSVGTLARLREEGKIRHIGLCNVTVPQVILSRTVAPIVSVQNRCNVLDRAAWPMGLIGICEREGLAFLPYAPVGGRRQLDRVASHPVLSAVATRHDATAVQVALAWLLAKSPVLIPIPGGRRAASVRSSAAVPRLRLSAEDLADLDRSFPTHDVPPGVSNRSASS